MTTVFLSMATRSNDLDDFEPEIKIPTEATPLPQPAVKMAWKTQMHLGVPHHIPYPGPKLGHQHLTGLRLSIV